MVIHLNCINLLMQFKWVPTRYLSFYKENQKKKHNNTKTSHKQHSISSFINLLMQSKWVPARYLCFYKENQKKKHNTKTSHKHHSISSFLKCTSSIGRYIFYHKFSQYFLKTLAHNAVIGSNTMFNLNTKFEFQFLYFILSIYYQLSPYI